MGASLKVALAASLLLLLTLAAPAVAFRYEVYSSVKYLEVVESPVGTELQLEIRGHEVTGTLKDYESTSAPIEVALRGTLVENKLNLAGSGARGRVEVSGITDKNGFRGVIKRWFGGNEHVQEIVLPRKARRNV